MTKTRKPRATGPGGSAPPKRAMASSQIDCHRVRVELVRNKMTLADLAKHIGCPPSTVSSWLRDVAPPPKDLRRRIAAILGVDERLIAPDDASEVGGDE